MTWDLHLDAGAIADLEDDPAMDDLLEDIADDIADLARANAPKLTGEGAASIHGQLGEDADGSHVDVSWSDDQFHMGFHEEGTAELPPRPFLRPALEQYRL